MRACNSTVIAILALLGASITQGARAGDAAPLPLWFANILPAADRAFIREHPVFDRMRRILDRAAALHQVYLAEEDLDNDGTPERLVMIQDAEVCGSAGCLLHVFKLIGGQWRVVATLSAHRGVIVGQSESDEGWRRLHNGRHLLYRWRKCGYHVQEMLDEYDKLGVDACATE